MSPNLFDQQPMQHYNTVNQSTYDDMVIPTVLNAQKRNESVEEKKDEEDPTRIEE